jgi:hypothetical protein
VHAPARQYFSRMPFFCITTLHQYFCMPNFSAHTRTPIFFAQCHSAPAHPARQYFFPAMPVQRQILARAPARQYFFAQCSACMPNFSACVPARQYFSTYHNIFTVHHAFLVCPPAHIHFYAHQFLVNSAAEIGAFA